MNTGMDELLKIHNYKLTDTNTWIKGTWTVRNIDKFIEVFTDPDLSPEHKYFIGPENTIDLKEILEEIDNFYI